MKVLVTGGAGYVGAVLVPKLVSAGHSVRVFDSFLYEMDPILNFDRSVDVIEGDVRDEIKVGAAVKGMDVVLHLAAIVGYPACLKDVRTAADINVGGTVNVVKTLEPWQKLVYASTGSTYGVVDGVCTEETPISPLTIYGRTKAEAERIVLERGGVSLRFATVFGVSPRMRLDLLVNDFVHQAVHNKVIVLFEGNHRRTFIHVKDVAEAYLFVLSHYEEMVKGRTYNVGNPGMNLTKREVAENIRERVEFYLHGAEIGKDLDARDYAVSYDKLLALGWVPEVSFDEGLTELLSVIPHMKVTNKWRNA